MFGSLTSFDPVAELRRLEREIDEVFGGLMPPAGIRSVGRGAFPPINVGATPEAVDVYLFAPGIDPKSLELSIQQNLLSISGQRQAIVDESVIYYRQERYSGEFRRVVTLPDDVDPERVDAKYQDGVLQVNVRRRESAKPRQIEVK